MQTFFDESKLFVIPKESGKHSISLEGALVIPDKAYPQIQGEFNALKAKWGKEGIEIKGSMITKDQLAELISMLMKYDVLFFVVMVDAKFHNENIVKVHRQKHAEHILGNISEFHHPNVVLQLKALSAAVLQFSSQLYIQFSVMTDLVCRAHEYSTMYYAQCQPEELGHFKWIIDAKSREGITKEEKWWRDTLPLQINGMCKSKHFRMLSDADYSHYSHFDGDEPNTGDIKRIMKDLDFLESTSNVGLQIVDILTGATRRGMENNFDAIDVGKLMILPIGYESFIPVYSFAEGGSSVIQAPYAAFIKKMQLQAKPIIQNPYCT